MGKFINIIIDFNVRYKAARDIIAGIMRYSASNPKWILHMRGNHPTNDRYHVENNFKADGLISGYDLSRNDEPGQDEVRALFRKGELKAATFVCAPKFMSPGIPMIHIDLDHRSIAHAAFRLLSSHGLNRFAFLGTSPKEECSRLRGKFFRQVVEKQGFSFFEFRPSSSSSTDWSIELQELRQWVRELPKPCGVLAVFDQRAKHLIDVCRIEGFSIPKEIQIVGVDNEEALCELTNPSLSSIEPDFEAAGYLAASELNNLLMRPKPLDKDFLIDKLTIVERLSTTDLTRTGDRVTRAIAYIRSHVDTPMTVSEVAKSVGGSVRLLERDFKQIRKHSISSEIQDAKLEAAAELLKNTSHPVSVILRRTGYKNISHLMTLFKKKYNMTMLEYRKWQRIR